VQTNLGSLVTVLGLVREQTQGSEDDTKFEPLRQPVQCCTATFQDMQEILNECTKYTKDGWDSVRDWLNMQYREKKFSRYEAAACQLQIHAKYCICVNQRVHIHSLFLRTATDFPSQDHASTQDSLNELRKSIEGTKEDLEDQLDLVRHAISGAGASLRDLF